MSDTPRADAAFSKARAERGLYGMDVMTACARQLERELAEARRLLADIRANAQCAHWHKDIDAMMKAE